MEVPSTRTRTTTVEASLNPLLRRLLDSAGRSRFCVPQAMRRPRLHRVTRGTQRKVNATGGQEGGDPVLACAPIDVAAIVRAGIERGSGTVLGGPVIAQD